MDEARDPAADDARPTVSFEFFPPRSDKAREELDKTARRLAGLGPEFMTVTYGAGGSTTDPTLQAVLHIERSIGVPAASHLTYVSTPIWQVASYAQSLCDNGISRVVALRGDPPAGRPPDRYGGAGFFHSTPAFIASLKTVWKFDVSVAAYPETHPDTPNPEGEIEMLARKADAGASRAITQFFFDNGLYYRFLDATEAAGVDIPIVPGILPVLDFHKMLGFAARCGATIPAAMRARFGTVTKEDARKIGEDFLLEQIDDLKRHGVRHFHIFTLNEAGMSEHACRDLGLGRPGAREVAA